MSVDLTALAKESVWTEKYRYADAERDYHSSGGTNSCHFRQSKQCSSQSAKCCSSTSTTTTTSSCCSSATTTSQSKSNCCTNESSIVSDLVKVRQLINKTLESAGTDGCNPYADRINSLETENQSLKKSVNQLTALVSKLELRVSSLEKSSSSPPSATAAATAAKPVAKPAATAKAEDNDSDVDLFGSDDDDDDKEADELKKKRLEEYANKKAKKPGVIAKSSVVLDIKPWDDETDMKAMEENVRKIVMDGLVWGASKLVPLAYGIKKLQIVIVIEDDKVSVEELTEKLEELEDYVQSVDIAAFNKI